MYVLKRDIVVAGKTIPAGTRLASVYSSIIIKRGITCFAMLPKERVKIEIDDDNLILESVFHGEKR